MNANHTIANLLAAEAQFLTDFGWKPLSGGRVNVRWRDPKFGEVMDMWQAVAKQKQRASDASVSDGDHLEINDHLHPHVSPFEGKITTEYEIETSDRPGNVNVSLYLNTKIDTHIVGRTFVISGARSNIEAFIAGMLSYDTLKARCGGPPEGLYGDRSRVNDVLDNLPKGEHTVHAVTDALLATKLIPEGSIDVCFADWAIRAHGGFLRSGNRYNKVSNVR